jgi:hypothetical protein
MLKFRKQHQDAIIQIVNYKGPITRDNISDPHVQRALAKHPKLWAEGAALEQVADKVPGVDPEPQAKTADQKAEERAAAAKADAEGRSETARLVSEARTVDGPQLTAEEANLATTDPDKAGTPIESNKGKAQPESAKGASHAKK